MKPKEGYNVSIRTITPADAARYLETSKRNRSINQDRVNRYAYDMASGRWSPATMLIIDEDGNMVDAHHRMKAVVQSDVPVQMCVFTGLPKRFIPYIDTGRPRSAGDMLAFIEGLDGVGSLRNKAVIARLVLKIRHAEYGIMPNFDDIAEFMLANKLLVEQAYQDYSAIKPLGATLGAGAAFFLIREANGNSYALSEFISKTATGEMLKAGMPAYALRNALFANSKTTHGGGARQKNDIYFVLKAWEAHATGKTMQILRRPKTITVSDITNCIM